MGKRANRRGKPRGYDAPLKIRAKDGTIHAVTTWPYQRKDKNGDQKPVPGIIVDGVALT